MRISCGELKRIARAVLNDRYRVPLGVFVMSMAILNLCELPFSMLRGDNPTIVQNITYYAAVILLTILGKLFTAGQYLVHLNMARGKEFSVGNIFFAFVNQPDRFLTVYGILMLLSAVVSAPYIAMLYLWIDRTDSWVLPLLIGLGVVFGILNLLIQILFQFVPFILLDYPNLGAIAVLKTSLALSKGNLWRIFVIYLSFIGMYLLGILSFGIGLLWIIPYQYQTFTILYLDINGEIQAV